VGAPPSSRPAAAALAGAVVLAWALAAVVWAWRVDVAWFERHGSLDANRPWVAHLWRIGAAAAGIALAVGVRPRVARWAGRLGMRELLAASGRVVVAVALALAVSEGVLRLLGRPRKHDLQGSCDMRLAEEDARYGWIWKARYSQTTTQGWREIRYDFDADRARARSPDEVPDPERPTILFVGESIVAGHGLRWEETLPAQVGSLLGLQVVDLGVDGYASDQAFLRLVDTLPHFSHVVAVVTLFFPALVDRVAWIDHPRLAFEGDAPVVTTERPFWSDLRVARVLREAFPYRDEASIALTGTIFQQTARLARAHGAKALFVAPYLGPYRGNDEPRGDGYLVDQLLRKQGLSVVDPRWKLEPIPGDRHPNAASTRRLAEAVAAALTTEPSR
jgi:hypothetical protein